jgi:hypothetical protein
MCSAVQSMDTRRPGIHQRFIDHAIVRDEVVSLLTAGSESSVYQISEHKLGVVRSTNARTRVMHGTKYKALKAR